MLFRGEKTEDHRALERTRRLLRELASANSLLDYHQLDASGRTTAIGRCRLFEFDEHSNVLVADLPTADGRPLQIQPHDACFVYLKRNGGLFRFQAEVVDQKIYRDDRSGWRSAMVLSAPATLENGNRRRMFRITPMPKDMPQVSWRPLVESSSNGSEIPWVPAETRDICGQGLSFWVSRRVWERLRIGLRVEVIIQLPGPRPTVASEATIRRLIEDPSRDSETAVCVEFYFPTDDPDACIDEIASFVAECQREIARHSR
jgi:hypothetical protein